MKNKLKVVLADGHHLFIAGLSKLLEQDKELNISVVDQVFDGQFLEEDVDLKNIDLLITDLRLPSRDLFDVLPEVKNNYPDLRILVLSQYHQYKLIKKIFLRGADGYLLKTSSPDILISAIQKVMLGERYQGPGVSVSPPKNGIIGEDKKWEKEDPFIVRHGLTKRELEILERIVDARNNRQIADELFISDQTVSVHRKNIMRKLNVSSMAGLIRYTVENRLLTD